MTAFGLYVAPSIGLEESDQVTDLQWASSIIQGRSLASLTALTGITFEEAWRGRLREAFGDVEVDFIGRESFLKNKRATGRAKDLGDIEGMESSAREGKCSPVNA